MSGIAALLARDGGPASATDVLDMLDAIPYRGPDGAHARQYGSAVLGHARLCLSARDRLEIQPLTSPRTGCAIVADLRLDNRSDVRGWLVDPPADDASDAQLVLRAYEELGVAAIALLRGDFAFAIWDPRVRRLVCARDGAGQRTLFYRSDAGTVAAASEIHQLLQERRVPLQPNEARIRAALAPLSMGRNAQERADTYFEGISALLPGHCLIATRDQLTVRRFGGLELPKSIRYKRASEYVDHFRELFFTAVNERLPAAAPVGICLSGGLDSSSIACAAQELYRDGRAHDHGFTSFSAVYDGEAYDERTLIADVQARYGFEARYVSPDGPHEWRQLVPDGFRARPELPTAGTASLFDAAQACGVRVLLTGEIADSYLRGSPLVFDSLLREGNFGAVRAYYDAYRSASHTSLAASAALYGVAPFLPMRLHTQLKKAYIRRKERLERWRAVPSWIADSTRSQLLDDNLALALASEDARVCANETSHMQLQLLDPPESPTIPWGWALEIWRPFAERRLQEFALAIPPEQLYAPVADDRWSYGGSKQLLRRAMAGMLPESIRLRTNPTHFTTSVTAELDRQWSRHAAVFGPDGESEIAARGYVDPIRFWDRLQQYRAGQAGADFGYLHFMISLETWLQSLRAPRAAATTVSTRVHARPAVLLDDALPAMPAMTILSSGRPDSRSTLTMQRR